MIRTLKHGIIYLIIAFAATPTLASAIITPFEATYAVYYGSLKLGEVRYRFKKHSQDIYQFDFDSQLRMLLLTDQRSVISHFKHQEKTLVPIYFTHQRSGTGKEYSEEIYFRQDSNTIDSQYKNRFKKTSYSASIYDPLSVQLQMRMDLLNNITELEYDIMLKNKVDEFRFRYHGSETLAFEEAGTFKTLKFEFVSDKRDKTTWLWFAESMEYLPLRIMYTEKGKNKGKVNMHLLRYQTAHETIAFEDKNHDTTPNRFKPR